MRLQIRIGDRLVGGDNPVFIIAEAGINYNGDFRMAQKLVEVAAKAGADAVKFQLYRAETLYSSRTAELADLTMEPGVAFHDIIRPNELSNDWVPKLASYATEQGLVFLTTPFDFSGVDTLESAAVPAYKWASGEMNDLRLMGYAASKGKPMIVSTGMANLADVEDALATIYSTGNQQVILLHCTSLYPTAPAQVNLRAMDTLKQAFGVPIGYSDHTTGIGIPIAAVARGASVIEKHITLDRTLPGPDQAMSLEPDMLKAMVDAIRDVEKGLGSAVKQPVDDEKISARTFRRSIISTQDIPIGTQISENMLTVKRPGGGIEPKFWDVVVGRKARMDIRSDDVITWEMV